MYMSARPISPGVWQIRCQVFCVHFYRGNDNRKHFIGNRSFETPYFLNWFPLIKYSVCIVGIQLVVWLSRSSIGWHIILDTIRNDIDDILFCSFTLWNIFYPPPPLARCRWEIVTIMWLRPSANETAETMSVLAVCLSVCLSVCPYVCRTRSLSPSMSVHSIFERFSLIL